MAFFQDVEFVHTGYGKNLVKVLYIKREGTHHYITELKANVELTLKTRKDYLKGDNSDIIPTDTIKNTVHALAKLKGVRCSHSMSSNTRVTCIILILSNLLICSQKSDNDFFFLKVKTIEDFALDICEHFLTSFKHVTNAEVFIEEAPWKRLEKVTLSILNHTLTLSVTSFPVMVGTAVFTQSHWAFLIEWSGACPCLHLYSRRLAFL